MNKKRMLSLPIRELNDFQRGVGVAAAPISPFAAQGRPPQQTGGPKAVATNQAPEQK